MKGQIKLETELDISLLNETAKGKRYIKDVYNQLEEGEIWVIKSWGIRFKLRNLVDLLFRYKLDVFHIEYGSVTRLYICKMDDYPIRNSVVYSLKNEELKIA